MISLKAAGDIKGRSPTGYCSPRPCEVASQCLSTPGRPAGESAKLPGGLVSPVKWLPQLTWPWTRLAHPWALQPGASVLRSTTTCVRLHWPLIEWLHFLSSSEVASTLICFIRKHDGTVQISIPTSTTETTSMQFYTWTSSCLSSCTLFFCWVWPRWCWCLCLQQEREISDFMTGRQWPDAELFASIL